MSIAPRFTYGSLDLTDVPFSLAFGSDLGAPETVSQVIDSMLADGEIVSARRTSNRSIAFTVYIEDADQAALAEGEAALLLEADKERNELRIDPGDGHGADTVFDTFRAQVRFVRDDDSESQGLRRYDVVMPATPSGRSPDMSEVSALTVGVVPSSVTISDGTSATGWTAAGGAALAVSSGRLVLPMTAVTYEYDQNWAHYEYADAEGTYTAAAPIDFSATPYLTLDLLRSAAYQERPNPPAVYVDGVLLAPLASEWVSGSEGIRATYLCTDASATTIRVVGESRTGTWGEPGTHSLLLDNVVRSNQPPSATTTGRATMRTLDIGGSARTMGSLRVGHDSTALGDSILYTTPALASGYRPDLRRYKSAGSVPTVDANTVSGEREDIGGGEFAVPAALLPEGGYVLVGRIRSKTGGPTSLNIGWDAILDVGTTDAGETITVPAVPVTVDTPWTNVVLGGTTLPPTRVTGSSGATVRIGLNPSASTVEWDEFWLFYLGDDAALTMVSCGTGAVTLGTAHNYLWVNAPTLASPEPEVMVGTLEDTSDSFHAGASAAAFGMHTLLPGENLLYLVSAAVSPDLSARYFKRWHTHNADGRTD